MDLKTKQDVIRQLAKQYRLIGKKQKGEIVSQLTGLTEYNRCYARLILRNSPKKGVRTRKKTSKYTVILPQLTIIWKATSYCCGQLLVVAIPEFVRILKDRNEIHLTEVQEHLFFQISSATIDRLLKPTRKRLGVRGRSGTKPGTLLKHQIPVRIYTPWDEQTPGFLEIDLVAHCGDSLRGEYINTLDAIDIATGWSEKQGLIGKGEHRTKEAFLILEKRFPFPTLGIDSDNGSEFINWHFLRFAKERHITFTRSRAYKKNDQAHIEQKNFSTVRKIIGYKRLETEEQLEILNEVYVLLSDYLNFFIPTFKLVKKEHIGSKVKRIYGKPKTPYQRVLDHSNIPVGVKQKLREKYQTLNPILLKKQIDTLIARLLDL